MMESLNHRPGLTFQNREENGFREPPGVLVCAIGSRTWLIPPDGPIEGNVVMMISVSKC